MYICVLLVNDFTINCYNDLVLRLHFAWQKERDSYSLTLFNNHWARKEMKMSECHMPKVTSIYYTNCNNLLNHPHISYPQQWVCIYRTRTKYLSDKPLDSSPIYCNWYLQCIYFISKALFENLYCEWHQVHSKTKTKIHSLTQFIFQHDPVKSPFFARNALQMDSCSALV